MVFTYLRKMKEIRTKIIAILLLASMILLTSCEWENPIRISLDPKEYNSEDFPVYPPFPDKIPENATVVGYRWYTYYHDEIDRYVELKFETEDECKEYLDYLLNRASQKNDETSKSKPSDGDWFIVEENPYNSSFVDYFDKDQSSGGINGMPYCTGYTIELSEDGEIWAFCNFSIISCSLSLHTIIITHCYGSRLLGSVDGSPVIGADSKVPIYLERFRAPIEPYTREHYFELEFCEN